MLLLPSCLWLANLRNQLRMRVGGLSIYLNLPPALSVDTRAGSIGDVSFSDVWVVQFGADDKKIKAVCYSGDAIKNVKIQMVVRIKHL